MYNEDLAYLEESAPFPLIEAWSGVDLVEWHTLIERQLTDMVERYVKLKNNSYVDKLRQVLDVWRQNPIDGSINVETISVLQAATAQLAVDPWKLSTYFRAIETNLRRIIASEQELPRVAEEPAGRAKPTPRYGGQKEAPAPTGAPAQGAPPTEAPPEK